MLDWINGAESTLPDGFDPRGLARGYKKSRRKVRLRLTEPYIATRRAAK